MTATEPIATHAPLPQNIPIRAISFDLDDTLWPVAPVLARAEEKLMAWLNAHYPRVGERLSVDAMRALRDQLMIERPELARDMTGLRKAVIRRAAEIAEYDTALVEPAFDVFLHYRNQIDFYPEVVNALHSLHARYRLGAISNGNADVARVGLSKLFCFAISASEFGEAKPHPSTFQAAAEAAGVDIAHMVHVGDDPHSDVGGARALGLRTVWVNRAGAAWPSDAGPRPRYQIRSLDELPRLLAAWESAA